MLSRKILKIDAQPELKSVNDTLFRLDVPCQAEVDDSGRGVK